MGKPFKLQEIEQQHGESLTSLIPRVVAEEGTAKAAADRLKTSQSTISKFMKEQGYVLRLVYVRAADIAPQKQRGSQ